jgi:hypothetical protein
MIRKLGRWLLWVVELPVVVVVLIICLPEVIKHRLAKRKNNGK